MPAYIYKLKWNDMMSTEFDVVCDVNFNGGFGEEDSYMNRDSVFTSLYNGARRHLYNYKYTDVLTPTITFMRETFTPFSQVENRRILSWLTSSTNPQYIIVYEEENVVKYRMFGNFTQIQQYKKDSEVIGYIATFESNAPYAFSDIITREQTINSSTDIILNNYGDLYDTLVYPKITYTQASSPYVNVTSLPPINEAQYAVIYYNTTNATYYTRLEGDTYSTISGIFTSNITEQIPTSSNINKYYYCTADGNIYKCIFDSEYKWQIMTRNVRGALTVRNMSQGDVSELRRLNSTETVTINGEDKVISTTWEDRIIGDDFNWTWVGLKHGENIIRVNGNGTIKFEYCVPIKCGDM